MLITLGCYPPFLLTTPFPSIPLSEPTQSLAIEPGQPLTAKEANQTWAVPVDPHLLGNNKLHNYLLLS